MKYSLIIALFISLNGIAQQDPLNAMYWNNYSYFNPAMSTVNNKHEANVTYRNQWDKVNGAPNSIFVNYGINLADKHGVGVNYLHDAIGFTRTNQVKINYNYQLKLKEDKKLVFGTAVSFQNNSISPEWNPPTTTNDPSLPLGFNENSFAIDLGLAYYGQNLIVGLGLTQLPIYPNPTQISSTGVFNYNTTKHLFGNFRYEAGISTSSKLIFETQLRTDFVKYSQDFNVGYNWRNILEGGIGFRTSDAMTANLTGIIKKKYRIGYSYAITINKLSSVSRGTHEIAIGLKIPNK